jgi:gamma-glutamyltranspeptidase/glutathione hydrolase
MGGDAQPQVLLQLLARTLISGQDPGAAVGAPRWAFTREASTGFDVWEADDPPIVALEHGAPAAWEAGLGRRGYRVWRSEPDDGGYGHAQMIRVTADDMLSGADDPRTRDGACVGL